MAKDFNFLLYKSAEENISINALVQDDTIWLTQKAMAELFGCSSDNISQHLKRIFSDGELDKDSVTEKISATASDGKKYLTQFYNLDAIISVGYRVNSKRATQFFNDFHRFFIDFSLTTEFSKHIMRVQSISFICENSHTVPLTSTRNTNNWVVKFAADQYAAYK